MGEMVRSSTITINQEKCAKVTTFGHQSGHGSDPLGAKDGEDIGGFGLQCSTNVFAGQQSVLARERLACNNPRSVIRWESNPVNNDLRLLCSVAQI